MPSEMTGGGPARPVALVTGASAGIGRDLALLLAERGYDLVLVARNSAALEELAGQCQARFTAKAHVLAADLADPLSPGRLAEQLASRGITVDILVNNAGFGVYGAFAQTDIQPQLDLLQVNITALTHLTRLLLPGMIQRGGGRILNVASTAAFVPGPLMSTYYASKAYVLSWSLALGCELRRYGITVTALCPGPTRTEFQKRAKMDRAGLFRSKVMESPAVARAGYQGLMAGRAIIIPGLANKLAAFATRFAPRQMLAKIALRLNRGR